MLFRGVTLFIVRPILDALVHSVHWNKTTDIKPVTIMFNILFKGLRNTNLWQAASPVWHSGTNGKISDIVVMLWDMGSAFYSKWAVMQWTHPSSLTATKCKVYHYAGRLLHLYSMLQESSELYSYFLIQKWMWTYAVTIRADCIRLLAGRGKNIWHEVWSLSTVIRIQYSTNTRSCCCPET
jgi:hypothetical protein